MATLQLIHYGKKGIYAYLCSVKVEGIKIERGVFVNGTPIEQDKQDFHRGKSATVEFDLSKFEDGWYEYKEASGHRAKSAFIEIVKGEIKQEVESAQELIDLLNPVPELPELEGSSRQVEWAEQIRATAIRGGFPIDKAAKYPQAKTWINSREKLAKYGVK